MRSIKNAISEKQKKLKNSTPSYNFSVTYPDHSLLTCLTIGHQSHTTFYLIYFPFVHFRFLFDIEKNCTSESYELKTFKNNFYHVYGKKILFLVHLPNPKQIGSSSWLLDKGQDPDWLPERTYSPISIQPLKNIKTKLY